MLLMFLILKVIPLSDLKKCDIMKKKLIDPNHSYGRSYLIEWLKYTNLIEQITDDGAKNAVLGQLVRFHTHHSFV